MALASEKILSSRCQTPKEAQAARAAGLRWAVIGCRFGLPLRCLSSSFSRDWHFRPRQPSAEGRQFCGRALRQTAGIWQLRGWQIITPSLNRCNLHKKRGWDGMDCSPTFALAGIRSSRRSPKIHRKWMDGTALWAQLGQQLAYNIPLGTANTTKLGRNEWPRCMGENHNTFLASQNNRIGFGMGKEGRVVRMDNWQIWK